MQRFDPWTPAGDAVKVADIDDASLKRIGQWPWSRLVIATLVRHLQDHGARAIAFDAVFSEPDRTSPARLALSWEKDYGWHVPAGAALPDSDQELAAAFARGRVVAGYSLLAEANGEVPAFRAGLAAIGADPAKTVQNFHGAIPNLAPLEEAAAGSGTFSITAGHDQVIRHMPMLAAFDGRLVASLSFEALRIAEDEDTIKLRAEQSSGVNGGITGYTARIGAYDIPLDGGGGLILHHGPRPPGSTIPAWRLLDPASQSELETQINGKIVLIGTSATGLSDLRATPLNPLEPGVNLHARILEQIIARHYLTRPAWAAGAEFAAAALLGLLLTGLIVTTSLRLAVLAGAVLIAAVTAGSCAAFSLQGLLFDPSLVILTAASGGIAASFARYLVAERDATRLRAAFTHYLSPDLVAALARNPDRLKLGGESRDMTFLFTDLEGFTKLTETGDPKIIVSLLNAYLDGLCSIVMNHGGTIDKIVGDAVHVMFNAPLDQPDHPARAVRCAMAMDVFGMEFVADCRARDIVFGVTRIGVNTGPAVVGNFGGSRRFDYTAHGDAINTAARLESANKALGTRVCVARSTADRVEGIAFLPVGTLMLKGKAIGVDVFTPRPETEAPPAWQAAYLEAFAQLVAGDEAAAPALMALHAAHPDQPVLALHARRIEAGERSFRMAA